MKTSAGMVINGVLRKAVSGVPLTAGTLLYHALAPVTGLILLADAPEGNWQATSEMQDWLLINGFSQHADIAPGGGTRIAQVNQLRARGYSLEFIIEPDPENAHKLIREGYSCLNFIHAQYSVPSWRPDYESDLRPWDDLAASVAHQARMKALDEKSRLRIPE